MARLIMAGRVLIISRVAGFRRAGVAHVGEQIWPAGSFSAEQIEQLKAEPNLIVRVEPDEEANIRESNSGGLDEVGFVEGEDAATKTETVPAEDNASAGTNTEALPAATSEGDGEAQPGPVGDASAVAADAAVLPTSDETAAAETGEGSAAEPDKAADPVPDAEKPTKKPRGKAAKAD